MVNWTNGRNGRARMTLSEGTERDQPDDFGSDNERNNALIGYRKRRNQLNDVTSAVSIQGSKDPSTREREHRPQPP